MKILLLNDEDDYDALLSVKTETLKVTNTSIVCDFFHSCKKVTIAKLCVFAAKSNKETINAATKKVTSARSKNCF
ncbi:hypothetical protein Tco_0012649 [Tanacetum coccineum]